MELTYEKNGEYLIPNLIPNREPEEPLTKYGLMRERYLKEHMGGVYKAMLLKGTLKAHCLEIQEQAEQRMESMARQMAEAEGVDERLKASDQMKWVARMNSIRQAAEANILAELIYSL